MTCCFFGHKDTPLNICEKLEAAIEELITEDGANRFLLRNQGNFDMITFNILRKMKLKHPDISYCVVLAYMPTGKAAGCLYDYSETLLPEGIESVHPRFAISWRNKWMINESDTVVAYVTRTWGGAAKYVEIAAKKRKNIINLAML